MVCDLVPMLGPASPAMSTKALKVSGCITVRSTAQVPPIEKPTMPQLAGSALTRKLEIMYGTTSLDRWSAALPRGPLTHSVSLLNAPVASTNTISGAYPRCAEANSSRVCIACPARSQSPGVLKSAPIIITVGNRGGGLLVNQAGGRYTSSRRWANFDASAGGLTGRHT